MHKQRVAILLSHYNGSDYLREQLNSILNQNADNFSIDIYVRDDGSNNVNLVNLRQMTSCLPINVFEGSNIGVTKSFLLSWSRLIHMIIMPFAIRMMFGLMIKFQAQ